MIQKMSDLIKDQDMITKASYEIFHFDQDKKTKTLIGGISSLLIRFIVMYIGIE